MMDMARRGWAGSSVAGITLCLLLACATARRGEPPAGPLKTADPAVARGEQIFLKNCDRCHPGGGAGVGPALRSKPLPGFLIKTQVRMGFGGMPKFKKDKISPAELEDIVAYLKALRKQWKQENPGTGTNTKKG